MNGVAAGVTSAPAFACISCPSGSFSDSGCPLVDIIDANYVLELAKEESWSAILLDWLFKLLIYVSTALSRPLPLWQAPRNASSAALDPSPSQQVCVQTVFSHTYTSAGSML